MSFLSILKNIWGGIQKAEPVIGTVLGTLNPAAGAIFNTVTTAISGAEQFFSAPQSGPQKSTFVTQNFESGLAIAQQIFALRGQNLTYNSTALQNFINAQVAAMNALSVLTGSMSTTPITASTPATTLTGAPVVAPPAPAPTPVLTAAPLTPVIPVPNVTQASTFLDPVTAKIIGL